jgi:hypothetical protein
MVISHEKAKKNGIMTMTNETNSWLSGLSWRVSGIETFYPNMATFMKTVFYKTKPVELTVIEAMASVKCIM